MQKFFLMAGALLGGLGIILGAFGAHALKSILSESGRQDVFETAVKYQFYHTFALLILGILMQQIHDKLLTYAGYSFIIGTLIFSGSLYILCITGITKLGAVTPIGGVIMIVGWALLFAAILRSA